jgi:hypothetical protein
MKDMHERSDAGLLDECCVCLEELGMMEACEQRRVPTVHGVLLSVLNVLCGGQSMHA